MSEQGSAQRIAEDLKWPYKIWILRTDLKAGQIPTCLRHDTDNPRESGGCRV
jgi:hypothetical protein